MGTLSICREKLNMIIQRTLINLDTEQDAHARSLLYFTTYVDGFSYSDWRYDKNPFFNKPNGYKVSPTMINAEFLEGKLMKL